MATVYGALCFPSCNIDRAFLTRRGRADLARPFNLRHRARISGTGRLTVTAMAQDKQAASPTLVEKLGIKVDKAPSDACLKELGVRSWPKWGCSPSKFPWTYDATETCYILEGKVKVYPEGCNGDFVEIGAGDLVVFPKGMTCTWEVAVTVDKHYKFS